jgi:hypothetical protein
MSNSTFLIIPTLTIGIVGIIQFKRDVMILVPPDFWLLVKNPPVFGGTGN